MESKSDFLLETLVDFPDDAIGAPEPITAAHIDAMMQRLSECGVRRVSWSVYGDGRGGFLTPASEPKYENLARTYQGLGQNPLAVAVEAAHRLGLEIYAYFKPYETGPAAIFPEGSYDAAVFGRLSQIGGRMTWIDPFVAENPHLRIKRRSDDLAPDLSKSPIRTLKLRKSDSSPTRITREHLQIWVSDLNYRYKTYSGDWTLTESIEPCPKDARHLFTGELVVRKGQPQRVFTLSGLEITELYALVTTDFAEGQPDFNNTDLAMLEAFDAEGSEIPGEIGSKTAIWYGDRISYREWGLAFDTGYNGRTMYLDEPGDNEGFVAFARERNKYLPGALCETEPRVKEFWLECLKIMLDTGVDGVDIREENHSTHTNHPNDYGYNDAVLDECRKRGKVDPATIAAVRGDAYTSFLADMKRLINKRGKKMRINFQIDWYRSDPAGNRRLAYPGNLDFQWQRWIEDDLTDEAVLRFYSLPFDCVFSDDVAQTLIEHCRKKQIPITVNRYIQPESLADEYDQIRNDGRFAGFILYETANFLQYIKGGECRVSQPAVSSLMATE
jgi:hypothetical protein